MTYQQTIQYLYNVAPLFQNIGQGAYKEGLSNTLALDEHFGHPHRNYKTIHIAGTNGKGSCSHTIAAILQSAGYKVGLYTSPHLIDFRERIRVNGEMIPKQRVIDFVEQERAFFEPLYPSFFELTTALAFKYFEEQGVDVAVIEVGLGGRLDCTNIISPALSVITNISFDHTQFLGDTLPRIASEKAGIIKPHTPVVIGETCDNGVVRSVFSDKALKANAPIVFADETEMDHTRTNGGAHTFHTKAYGDITTELSGNCQYQNTRTILCALPILETQFDISPEAVTQGFRQVCQLTGLQGRWQTLATNPRIVCDTGHNPAGLKHIAQQLKTQSCKTQRMVIGMVSDKDVKGSLSLLPTNAEYYFCQASVKRALPADEICALGHEIGLHGKAYGSVHDAYKAATDDASPEDFIFVGGSSFVVADLLTALNTN